MGVLRKERCGIGHSRAAESEGGEPRQSRAGCWLRRFNRRELVAAHAGVAGGAVRFLPSRASSCAGEPNLTSSLFAWPLPRRSREPRRATRRPIFVARRMRASRLCVLIIQSCRERSIGSCRRNTSNSNPRVFERTGFRSVRCESSILLQTTPKPRRANA
jgi:hypothetical protein